jgi:surface protein
MKNHLLFFSLSILFCFFSEISYSQTPITNSNFNLAIATCLSTNPVDGMCTSSQYGAMPNWNVSNVTDMAFTYFERLDFNADISNWDVSNVTDMNSMFAGTSFNRDISSWNVNNVTNMSNLFSNTIFNQDIGIWDVSNIIVMDHMFSDTPFNQDISSWNVSNVENMSGLFAITPFNQDISNWDMSNVTNTSRMFANALFNQDVSNWDVSNVTDMSRMFIDASFNQAIGNWNVSNVSTMEMMFYRAHAFNQEIGNWDVSNVTNTIRMFFRAFAFNQDISNWDVSNVADMTNMFNRALAFDQDLSNWNVSQVTTMNNMFFRADAFNQDISSWDVSNVTDMTNMFHSALVFNQDISAWNVSQVINMNSIFFGADAFNQDISNWDVSNVTDMSRMFEASNLSTENYDTILNGWSALPLQPSVELGATGINYCNGELARQIIINVFGWNIIDAGLSASCVDSIDPIAICQDITIQLDTNGFASINGVNIDGGSTDNIGIVSYTAVPDSFNCTNIGNNTVTLIVADALGNTDSCTAIVTIEDNINPNVIGQNAEGNLLGTGSVTIPVASVDLGSTDNCSIDNLTLSPDTFTSIGTYAAVLEGTDLSGNSDFANITITIIDTVDNTDPIAICQDITVQLDINGIASINGSNIDGGSTDNVSIVSYAAEPNNFNCNNIGTNIVTLTVTDAAGNSDTCTAIVTIEDNITPNVIGQNAEGNLNGTSSVTIPVSIVDIGSTDNCNIENLTLTPNTFTSIGTYTAVLEGTDPSGNTDDASVIITIIDDVLNTLEFEFTDFSMYPNPANTTITIDGGENTLLKRFEIFDISGKRIITKEIERPTRKFNLDISSLEISLYFVSIIDVNGRKVMRKLIKE